MGSPLIAAAWRWLKRVTIPLILIAMLLAALFIVADAQGLGPRYQRWYPMVFLATAVALGILILGIAQRVWRLIRQLRRGEPGARLTLRLLLVLLLLALPPLLLVYGFGLRFIYASVDSWFTANSTAALEDALALGRKHLDERIGEARSASLAIADELSLLGDTRLDEALENALDRSHASQLSIYEADGRLRAIAAADPSLLLPTPPLDEARLALRARRQYSATEREEEALHVRVLTRLPNDRLLQSLFTLPAEAAAQTLRIEAAVHAQSRALFLRDSLKLVFVLILSLVLALSLLGTVLAAFGLARRVLAPITRLATATRQVAEGRFDAQLPEGDNDELGFLVRSFNRMTRELELARARIGASAAEAERQRAFLETVLTHLSSGVLVVDGGLQLRSMNAAAKQLLALTTDQAAPLPLAELRRIAPNAAPMVDVLLQRLREGAREWREEITLPVENGPRVLLLRGARLPDEGAVAVFDDATVIDQARREAAWSEVARRLAHEIKNPLTPIQLAAERLRRRVLPKLDEDDAQVLDRATNTIVAQVDALKTMVNSFGDYARPPSLALAPLDLNRLVGEVLDLYEHDQRLTLARNFAPGLAPITADAGRIRQVLHNLIKNAIEAAVEHTRCCIEVHTRQIEDGGRRFVELSVADDGPGLPKGFDTQWFEPYRSTKPRGTGLGLAIVARIAQEHGAQFTAHRREQGGAMFVLRLPA
jgi:nitrogen fixation/metabolism regulation signal transduction histidine kinase